MVPVPVQNGRGNFFLGRNIGSGAFGQFGRRLLGKMINKMQGCLFFGDECISRFFYIHEFHACRIGNRHRETAILRHGQKCGVEPGTPRHTERHIG